MKPEPVLMWLLVPAPVLVGFSAFLIIRLRNAGYTTMEAVGVAGLALAQPAFFGAQPLRAVLFSVATYAVAESARAFAQRQDPRRIILFGGSLAGAQLANPVLGMATSVVLPLTMRKSVPAVDTRRLTGLFISVLFVPTLMGLSEAYLLFTRRAEFAHWATPSDQFFGDRAMLLPAILLTALPLLVALRARPVASVGRIAISICCILIATGSTLALFCQYPSTRVSECSVAVGILTVYVVANWAPGPSRFHDALRPLIVSVVSSWLLVHADTGGTTWFIG